ncbi:MAG: D-alanyl-D-alanine carboxypeptidase, partial [Acetobacteraceae bacterium]|nr:D-alanyl-D-alanine carboxypeptidase [Acetobacteraceae bacterium]
VPLVGGRNLVVTLPRGWRRNASIQVTYDGPIMAPVQRGSPLGKLTVSGHGVPPLEAPLLAGTDVPKLGLPGRAMAVLSHYVSGS